MNCVPLISDRPSLAPRRTGSSPARSERLGTREERAFEPRMALADEREREMGERCEVAAGAHRAASRDVRQDAAVEAFDQQLDRLDPRARVALRERVRPQQHRRADDAGRIGLADAARVAAQQAELELVDAVVGDRLGDEAAEARVDAVGVLGRLLDERTGRLHLTARLVGEADGRAVHGDLPDVLQPEVVPGQRVTRDHAASLARLSGAWVLRCRACGAGSPPRGRRGSSACARRARRSGPATAARRAAARCPPAR